MRNIFERYWNRFRNIILYGIIGCCSSGLDFMVFTILENVGTFYIVANCISVLIGISTSFTLNRKYNFKVMDQTAKRFIVFLTIGICGLITSNLILYISIDVYQMNSILSKLLSIVLVVVFQFVLNKYVTFKETVK